MKRFGIPLTILGVLAASASYAGTIINVEATVEPEYQFVINGYHACNDADYPVRNAFGKGQISSVFPNGMCANGNCNYKFDLKQQTSFDYYESDGAQCVKKTANESTPGFMKVYRAKIPFQIQPPPHIWDFPSKSSYGEILQRSIHDDTTILEVEYKTPPTSDQIVVNGNTINVRFK